MMAAALAYYTAFSLPPLLVLVVTVAGWIWSPEAVTAQLERHVSGVVGGGGWRQVETMMQAAGKRGEGRLAATVGIIGLLLGATGVMVQLQAALNRAWEVQPAPESSGIKNLVTKRILSLAMILAVAFLLLVSLVLTAVLKAAGERIVGWLPQEVSSWIPVAVHQAVSLLVFTLLIASMFKWLPDARVRWTDLWLGAATTALLFLVGNFVLGLYFSRTDTGTYGAAAAFALLLLWVYYSGIIFLLGAEFIQVWARRRGSGIKPAAGAVRVVVKTRSPGEAPASSRR